jgi:hypothetical protein
MIGEPAADARLVLIRLVTRTEVAAGLSYRDVRRAYSKSNKAESIQK